VLQVMEITENIVIAVNLMDEAKRKGLEVDARSLSRDLGVPAIPVTARTGEGIHTLLSTVADVIEEIPTKPLRVEGTPEFQSAVNRLSNDPSDRARYSNAAGWRSACWMEMQRYSALLRGPAQRARQQRADVQFSRKMAVEGRQ
jgi:ferrous iron transport protein B